MGVCPRWECSDHSDQYYLSSYVSVAYRGRSVRLTCDQRSLICDHTGEQKTNIILPMLLVVALVAIGHHL